jgi:superoxide dismutase, Cu-Zn family
MKPLIWTMAFTAVACATAARSQDGFPVAEIKRADGQLAARAMAFDDRGGIQMHIQAQGLAAGTYGVHLHAIGRCEGPSFESAGPHWNPTGRQHGARNPQGRHLGDLPNLVVEANGGGRIEFAIAGSSSAALADADGTAVVIHAGVDDYLTDPSGNSGARIACGVLAPPRQP